MRSGLWCVRRASKGGNNFGGDGLAGLAGGIVDAALRKRERTAAVTGFRVEFVEGDDFLLGREFSEIDAGKLAGAVGILQENLSGVLEGLHFEVADRQAEERADFGFVKNRVVKAFVLLHDAALGIEHEGSGKRGDATVLGADVIGGKRDRIIDAEFGDKFPDAVLIIIINDEAENLQAVLVFILERDEVRDFGAAWSTPSGPEIQEEHFAARAREGDGFSIEAIQLEIWCGLGVANEADCGQAVLRGEYR